MLKGVFQNNAPVSYPGRIYGKYKFNWKKYKWEIDKEFCENHNIKY